MPRTLDPLLRKRVASALVLAPIALAFIAEGGWPFALMVAVLIVIMGREWGRLQPPDAETRNYGTLTGLLAGGIALGAALVTAWGQPGVALAGLAAAASVCAVAARRVGASRLAAASGALYLGVPGVALVWLRGLPEVGFAATVFLVSVIWATDVFAYVVGRRLGGPKLAPRISPSKTWAGLWGGVAGAALVAAALAALLAERRSVPGALVFAALLALVAQAGDLFESALKRRAGLKDSGSIIPGHGGMLDRLDGLLFAAPVVAAGWFLFGKGVLPWL